MTFSHALKVVFPEDLYVGGLLPSVLVLGGVGPLEAIRVRWCHKDGPLMRRPVPFQEEEVHEEEVMWRQREMVAIYKPGRGPRLEPNLPEPWFQAFQTPEPRAHGVCKHDFDCKVNARDPEDQNKFNRKSLLPNSDCTLAKDEVNISLDSQRLSFNSVFVNRWIWLDLFFCDSKSSWRDASPAKEDFQMQIAQRRVGITTDNFDIQIYLNM